MKLNGSDIIAEVLIEQGVDTVFGYPGGAVLNIYDALYKYRDKIHHILTAHEQGASHAADGYARATGKTGVVIGDKRSRRHKPCYGNCHGIYGQHTYGSHNRQRRNILYR